MCAGRPTGRAGTPVPIAAVLPCPAEGASTETRGRGSGEGGLRPDDHEVEDRPVVPQVELGFGRPRRDGAIARYSSPNSRISRHNVVRLTPSASAAALRRPRALLSAPITSSARG